VDDIELRDDPCGQQCVKVGDHVFRFVQTRWLFPLLFVHLNTFLGLITCALETYPDADVVMITNLQWINFIVFLLEFALRIVAETTRPWMVLYNPESSWRRFDLLLIVLTCPMFVTVAPFRCIMVFRLVDHGWHFHKVRVLIYGVVGGLRQTMTIGT
jgi:hypothetical protein